MKKIFILWVISAAFFLSYVKAQLEIKIPFEIKLKSVSFNKASNFLSNILGGKIIPVYKFYIDSLAETHSLHHNLCYSFTVKDKSQIFNLSENNTYGGPLVMITNLDLNINKEIKLVMENYQNDKGDVCYFDKGDAKHKVTFYTINIAALKHGITQPPITINSDQNQYAVTISYRLGLPLPSTPVCDSIGKFNDGTKTYIFKASLNLINKEGLQLEWQASTDKNHWTPLFEKTSKEELSIIPEKDIIKTAVKSYSKCFLRYRIISPELTSEWVEKMFDIIPPKPVIKKSDILSFASCSSIATGKIIIKSIRGQTDNYRIILFKGNDIAETKCFENITEVCPESIKDTIINSSSTELNNIASGDYTLFVGNANIASNFYDRNTIKLDEFPKLAISNYGSVAANCSVNPSGSINIETKGGNPDSLAFLVTPVAGELIKKGRNAYFNKLPEGGYNVLVKDACNQIVSTPIISIELKNDPLKADITIFKKPDFNKNNGTLIITMKNGSGLYTYKLFVQDNLMKAKEFSGVELVLDSLYGAKYKIQVSDKNAPKCTGWSREFIFEQLPPPAPPAIKDTTDTIKEKL